MMWRVEKVLKIPEFKNRKIAILVYIFKNLKPIDYIDLKNWFSRAIIEALRIEQNQTKEVHHAVSNLCDP